MSPKESTASERALRLHGRIQALTDVSEQVARLGEATAAWGAFTDWLKDAEAEVGQELEMLKAEIKP